MGAEALYKLPGLPHQPADRRQWSGLPDAAQSLVIAETAKASQEAVLVVTADTQAAERIHAELSFFLADEVPILRLPDWETLIYDSFSPHQDIVSDRLAVFNRLPGLSHCIIVVPTTTLLQKTAPKEFILGSSLLLNPGQKFDINTMRHQLQGAAYNAVATVLEHGEYAVRGSIMDIYPMGSPLPFRIDLFDDEIETIRTFDPETQRSIVQVDGIDLLPAREFPLTEEAIKRFQDQWFLRFQGDAQDCPIYRDVSSGLSPAGIEYYLPLFFDGLGTLFDYLPDKTLVFCEDMQAQLDNFLAEADERYESLRHDVQRPILAPKELLLGSDELFARLKQYPRIDLSADRQGSARSGAEQFDFAPLPDLTVADRAAKPLAALADFLASDKRRLLIAAESNGRREVVDTLLAKHGLQAAHADSWADFVRSSQTPLA
ncbi:MAG: transcription-repair coupling factor, partial [Pseudomonadales bacterium]